MTSVSATLPASEAVEVVEPEITPAGTTVADLRHRAVRGGMIMAASRLVVQLISWTVTLLVARFLRPYDYGLVTTTMVFVGLADLLAEAGLGRALVWKPELRREDVSEAFTASLLLAVGLYALLVLGAGPIADFLATPELRSCLPVLACAVLLMPFRSIPAALLERQLRMGQQSVINVVGGALQSLVVVTLVLAGAGYWALVVGFLSVRALEVVLLTGMTGWRPRLSWPLGRQSRVLSFGAQVSVGGLLWFVYSNSDYAILGKLVGPGALGYYAIAFELASLPVQKLTSTCSTIAYPVLCRLQHDPERLRDWYLRLTGVLGAVGIPVLAGLALVAEEALTVVLGAKWLPAVFPLQLLCVYGTVAVVSATLPPLLNALGRPDLNIKYNIACITILPAGFVLFGYFFGVTGVCVTWLVGFPLIVAALVYLTRHVTGLGLRRLLACQRAALASAALMAVVVLATRWAARSHGPTLRLALAVAAGAGTYSVSLWILGRQSVLRDLRSLLSAAKRPA